MHSNSPGGRKLPPTARSLPIALIRAREHVMGPIRQMLADTGLTEQQWRILRVLDEHGPQDPTQLARRACLLLPSQTRIVQALVARGLIDRQPDKHDRRRQILSLTPEGRAVIEANIDQALEIARRYETALGRDKLQRLLDLLQELENV